MGSKFVHVVYKLPLQKERMAVFDRKWSGRTASHSVLAC